MTITATTRRLSAVALVFDQRGHILVTRPEKWSSWGFPECHLEPGYDPIEAAQHAVAEEVGIDIEIIAEAQPDYGPGLVTLPPPWRLIDTAITGCNGRIHHHVQCLYIAKPAPGADPKPAGAIEHRFMTPHNLDLISAAQPELRAIAIDAGKALAEHRRR